MMPSVVAASRSSNNDIASFSFLAPSHPNSDPTAATSFPLKSVGVRIGGGNDGDDRMHDNNGDKAGHGGGGGRLSLHRIQRAKQEWEEHRRCGKREAYVDIFDLQAGKSTGALSADTTNAVGATSASAAGKSNDGLQLNEDDPVAVALRQCGRSATSANRSVVTASAPAPAPAALSTKKGDEAAKAESVVDAEREAPPPSFSFSSKIGNPNDSAKGAFSFGIGKNATTSAAGGSGLGFAFEATPGGAFGTGGKKPIIFGTGSNSISASRGVGTNIGLKPFSLFGAGESAANSSSFSVAKTPAAPSGRNFAFGGSTAAFGGFGGGGGATASPFTAVTPFGGTAKTTFGSNGGAGSEARLFQQKMDQKRKEKEDHKKRLTEFYEKHNPSKVSDVDKTLVSYHGREDELFRKLEQKYGVVASPYPNPPPVGESGGGPKVFIELSLGGARVGRVVMKLFANLTPIASENFRALCTGEISRGGRRLHYEGASFHRIVENFVLQGGDFTKGDGTGGASIYPPNSEHGDGWGKFKDEKPFLKHSRKGLLSMANNGADRNGSQFFVTLKALPFLDGKHVVFGEVVDGMNVFERIVENVQVDSKTNRPKADCRVVIEQCGEIVEGR